MSQHLLDELARYQDREQECDRIRDFIEDTDQDLDLTANQHESIVDSLKDLAGALDKKIIALDQLIEAARNESMDRFRRRQV